MAGMSSFYTHTQTYKVTNMFRRHNIIRESVDSLCRDGADMRGDAHNMKSFQTRRVGNPKPFKALYRATEVLLYLLVRSK